MFITIFTVSVWSFRTFLSRVVSLKGAIYIVLSSIIYTDTCTIGHSNIAVNKVQLLDA